MSYEDTLRRLGNSTADSLAAIFGQWQSKQITKRVANQLMKTVVLTAKQQGANFGVLSFHAYMQTTTGVAGKLQADTQALTPGEIRAMQQRINEIMRGPLEDMPLALERMGFNAPVYSTTESFRRAMIKDGRSVGYIRGLESTACQICQWIYKDGHVYPIDMPMWRHPGCVCAQVPVTNLEEYRAG